MTAIRHVHGYRALHRWPSAAAASDLACGGDLGAWWHQQAQQLTTGPARMQDTLAVQAAAGRGAARRAARGDRHPQHQREFGEDLRVGLRRHLPAILELFADSALASHGLINPDLLRRQLLRPQVDYSMVFALEDLLGCESWLRATQRSTSPGRTSATATAP